jgi:7,8-dihydropterin-6-yl-methyl-4-(beta-D-ribofuranosyl)aminobenzene 5'-phosphate synthase
VGLRISTLSENTAHIGDFVGEWGLSILVETDETTVLLDAGKGLSASYNADALGVDLNRVDKILLSHGHYDHTGGLSNILRRMKKDVEVIAHPDVWQAKYSRRKDSPDRYIGIPFREAELSSLGATFIFSSQPVQLGSGIWSTGQVPMVTAFEEIDKGLFVKDDSGWHLDQVMDDQALILTSPMGLVVLPGCAHRGIVNTILHARKVTGIDRVFAVIGGSHLMNTSEERLWQTIDALREMGVERLGLCHCTDLPAASRLANEFGDVFFFNKAGTSIVI